MRVRGRIAAFFKSVCLAGASVAITQIHSAYADQLTYENARFGTRVTFPAELFATRQPRPANGDGMRWTTRDGGSMAVLGAFNVPRLSPKTYLDQHIGRLETEAK